MNDFTTTLELTKSPTDVFNAIMDVRNWWTGDIDGDASKLGDEFTYRYGDVHYSKQQVTELVRDKKIVWHVVDANLSFADNASEWKGTDLVFEIKEENGKTQLHFTHNGLVPQFDCYEACSNGWDFLINTSLRNFITTGEGPSTPPWA